MTRRSALAVFAAAALLLLAVNAVIYSQYRTEASTVSRGLDDRLVALGATTARWLEASPDPRTDAIALSALATENQLEDVYVVDGELRVVSGVSANAGTAVKLSRGDEDRLREALGGRAWVGDSYAPDHARIEVAYFPFDRSRARYVLALEAGTDYHAPVAQLRTTYLLTVSLTVLVAIVFAIGLGLALRALERARLDHGRAERLEAVGQMAAMVAHEVRNPLGILRGQVELARERLGDAGPPRVREQMSEMLVEIERINRMTEEFIGLARDAPLELGEVDVGALITEIADAARLATDSGATIDAVPPAAAIRIDADATKLRQAIYNLVLNAVQVGGASVHVTVEARVAGGQVRVSVSDDGPGVPPEIVARLAEPFVTARPGGIGLGLTIARRAAERHGGTLALDTPPGGRGARFTIDLPVTRGAA